MKKLLSCVAVFTASAGLITGCSTNTQGQNTGIGAVSGAVVGGVASGLLGGNAVAIGLSAIGGALIGGYIGHSVDHSDATNINNTLSTNATNMPSHWTNPKTGVVYRITPTSDVMTYKGNSYCRNYTATAVSHSKKHTNYGTACRQADGSWVLMKR